MSHKRAGMLSLLGLVWIAGCSDSGGDDVTTIVNSLFRGAFDYTANGGNASGNSTATLGGFGGGLFVASGGNIFVGQNPPPLAPAMPSAPSYAEVVGSWTDVQTIDSGNAVVSGNIVAGTTGTDATLNVTTGDLVINGTITSADNGAVETHLVINVPAGTVFLRGTIRTGRVDAAAGGDDGGSVTIRALRIIFTGAIDTRGENNPAGDAGFGGDVTFSTDSGTGPTSQLLVGGSMNLSGGDATGGDVIGGDSGSFFTFAALSANGAVHINGTSLVLDGGDAAGSIVASGGFGGTLDLEADAGVFFSASLSAAGGAATSSAGDAFGGNGGTVVANFSAVADSGPCSFFGSVNLSGGAASCGFSAAGTAGDGGSLFALNGSDVNFGGGLWSMRGGDSASGSGNQGGAVNLQVPPGFAGDILFDCTVDVSNGSGPEPQVAGIAGSFVLRTDLGDIQISGLVRLNGGDGSNPLGFDGTSAGGTVFVRAGNLDVSNGGSITLRGTIQALGGTDGDPSDDTDGAPGGSVELFCSNGTGSIYLDPGSSIQLDGGDAGGPAGASFGGDGGFTLLHTSGGSAADGTVGGNILLRGSLNARGGSGGGFGGMVIVDSDSPAAAVGGADGRGGNITLESTAVIDVSGGPGGLGDALNDGLPTVTAPVAVTLDADGLDSDDPAENGVVLNLGFIVARGVGFGAFGGDVRFDGLDDLFSPGPAPGALDLFGDGAVGDFLSE